MTVTEQTTGQATDRPACPAWCGKADRNHEDSATLRVHTRRTSEATSGNADIGVFVQRSDTNHHGPWETGAETITVDFYLRRGVVLDRPGDITRLTPAQAEDLARQWDAVGATEPAAAVRAAISLLQASAT